MVQFLTDGLIESNKVLAGIGIGLMVIAITVLMVVRIHLGDQKPNKEKHKT